jgi:hypothetical protein
MNKNIFGLIGYTVLDNGSKKVLVMADRHDELPPCDYDYHNIADWLKDKFYTSDILLEEVERDDNELQELWATSPHTQDLKNLYLNNTDIVVPIDIRNDYIPFSWELFDKDNNDHDINVIDYLQHINSFFTLGNKKLTKLAYYNIKSLKNTSLGNYYLIIKKQYKMYIHSIRKYLYIKLKNIDRNIIFNKFNNILNSILEWYAISKIIYSKKKSIIIHTGLAHSEVIVKNLIEIFNYNILHEDGINNMSVIETKNLKSCFRLPISMHNQFGGYY